jgi:hypothetical protein
MKTRMTLLTLMMLLIVAVSRGQVWEEWAVEFSNPYHGAGEACAIALDTQGNPVLTGFTSLSQGQTNFGSTTIKCDPLGEMLWISTFDTANTHALVLDDQGNVYLAGARFREVGSGSWNADFLTIKCDADGRRLWSARYDSLSEVAEHIALDNAGDVIVAGTMVLATEPYDFQHALVAKYSPQGVRLWTATFGGSAPGSPEMVIEDMAVDNLGNIYLTGSGQMPDSSSGYITVKFDPQGTLQWAVVLDEGGQAQALDMDAEGNVYVTGWAPGGPWWNQRIATVKYDSLGNQVWAVFFAYFGIEEGRNLALDAQGNVLVSGSCNDYLTDDMDFLALKYNAAGELQWFARYDGPEPEWENWAYTMTLDDSSCVYQTGHSSYGSSRCWQTVKYDPAGNLVWEQRHDGPGLDYPRDLVVDANWNIYILGERYGSGASFSVLKINQVIPNVTVALVPSVQPILIPAFGGRFDYNIAIANVGSSQIAADVWCMATLPNGRDWGPLLGPVALVLPVGSNINRDRSQTVPGVAPAGNYVYHAYIGDYPGTIWDEDSFPFTKSATGDGNWYDEWSNTGESFDAWLVAGGKALPERCSLSQNYPNPFNPRTAISYQLSADSHVKLEVFDTAGRLVSTLVNGWRESGSHQVTWDASGLASGIYLYRMEVSGSGTTPTTVTGKMVLMK